MFDDGGGGVAGGGDGGGGGGGVVIGDDDGVGRHERVGKINRQARKKKKKSAGEIRKPTASVTTKETRE